MYSIFLSFFVVVALYSGKSLFKPPLEAKIVDDIVIILCLPANL